MTPQADYRAEAMAWRAYYDVIRPEVPTRNSEAMRDWAIRVGTLYAEAQRMRDHNSLFEAQCPK